MRPQIILPKGAKSPIPSIMQNPPAKRIQPKKVDHFMDKVVDVKDVTGKVIFTGTPRQWQAWASQREREARLAVGLPPTPNAGRKTRYRR